MAIFASKLTVNEYFVGQFRGELLWKVAGVSRTEMSAVAACKKPRRRKVGHRKCFLTVKELEQPWKSYRGSSQGHFATRHTYSATTVDAFEGMVVSPWLKQ